jgi:hypothetical protein
VADADKLPSDGEREPFFASVVEREVLAKHRRALLVVGGNHLRRGIRTTSGELVPATDPNQPSAGTLIANRHPGALFVVLPFSSVIAAYQSLPRGVLERLAQTLGLWPVPSIATVANTWLGPQTMPDRALDPTSTFQDQADAVLWVGPDEALTCARADPAVPVRRLGLLDPRVGQPSLGCPIPWACYLTVAALAARAARLGRLSAA